jgi:hypothetical protein
MPPESAPGSSAPDATPAAAVRPPPALRTDDADPPVAGGHRRIGDARGRRRPRRGRALFDGGQPERAILYLHEHLERRPDDAWLHFQAGRAAWSKGLAGQAKVRFAHYVPAAA